MKTLALLLALSAPSMPPVELAKPVYSQSERVKMQIHDRKLLVAELVESECDFPRKGCVGVSFRSYTREGTHIVWYREFEGG